MSVGNVAVFHDAYTSDGGAERVAAAIARTFDAPIYATVADGEATPDDIDVHELWTGRAARFWNERSWWMPRMPYWMGRHIYRRQRSTYAPEITDYDVVIETKGPVWPYVPKPHQTVVRYVHSPPRRHYDRFHDTGGSFLSRMWSMWNRTHDGAPQRYPDRWVANSDVVARRVQLYYDVPDDKLDVVYPGISMPEGVRRADGGYYLYLGRLAKNKRIDLICDLARETDQEIVVAGSGAEADAVESCRAPNLTYHGYVEEARKWELLANARATLFFAEAEDFGIVPIESMAVGTPVIGVDEGFTQYQIQDGKNGYLCEASVADARDAMKRINNGGVAWERRRIEDYAQQFSMQRFENEMRDVVGDAVADSRIQPQLTEPIGVTQ